MNFKESLLPSLRKRFPQLDSLQVDGIVQFAGLLYDENQKQNLTRIEGVDDFIEGHVLDVVEFLNFGPLGERIADIGSGSGVPGLLAAIISKDPAQWHLIESEAHKANYLSATASIMNLKQVFIHHARAEAVIKKVNPTSVTARAVGSVDKIASWIWDCSTWNNIILFKSKGWAEEWERARLTKLGRKLTVTHTHEYSSAGKYRVLVKLTRS